MAILPNQLPINSRNRIKGISRSQFLIEENLSAGLQWDRVEISLWTWLGQANPTTGTRGEEYKFVLQNWNNEQFFQMDIKPYVMKAFPDVYISQDVTSGDEHNLSHAVFYAYLYRFMNGNTNVGGIWEGDATANTRLRAATRGWSYRESQVLINNVDPTLVVQPLIDNQMDIYPTIEMPNAYISAYNYNFTNVLNTNSIFPYTDYFPTNLICGDDNYYILFINQLGQQTILPLRGQVQGTVSVTSTKYMNGKKSLSSNAKVSYGDYSLINQERNMTWVANTGYLTKDQYNYFKDVVFSPYTYLINRVSGKAARINITGDLLYKTKRIDNKLFMTLQFEELIKLL